MVNKTANAITSSTNACYKIMLIQQVTYYVVIFSWAIGNKETGDVQSFSLCMILLWQCLHYQIRCLTYSIIIKMC